MMRQNQKKWDETEQKENVGLLAGNFLTVTISQWETFSRELVDNPPHESLKSQQDRGHRNNPPLAGDGRGEKIFCLFLHWLLRFYRLIDKKVRIQHNACQKEAVCPYFMSVTGYRWFVYHVINFFFGNWKHRSTEEIKETCRCQLDCSSQKSSYNQITQIDLLKVLK